MVYSSDGKAWELLSYGADCQPGGIGLDADIRCTDASKPTLNNDSTPTIKQVVRSPHFGSTVVFSVFVGILGFIGTCRHLFSPKKPVTGHSAVIIATVAHTIAGSIVAIGLLTFLSVASSH